MSRAALSVLSLTKRYRVYSHPSQLLLEAMGAGERHKAVTALNDVSFELKPGEVVGVMGRNGAGKSTLLRIVAGTLEPTQGAVEVNGRVSAILELGSGFHPDYSGRENVVLGGLCMGMSRDEIDAKFDQIVAFAELGAVIDRPFRTYSTGMQARLTFSVAMSVDPDILIIDEALSVGDARFALKSFDRIRAFKAAGKTILFVSHSISQVLAICDRALLLESGRVIADGDPNEVGALYHELLFGAPGGRANGPADAEALAAEELPAPTRAPEPAPHRVDVRPDAAAPARWDSTLTEGTRRYGDGTLVFTRAAVLTLDGRPATLLQSGRDYELRVEIQARETVEDYCFGVIFRDPRGVEVYGLDTHKLDAPIIWPALKPGEKLELAMRFTANLAAGPYFLMLGLARSDEHKYDMRFDALQFEVAPTPDLYTSSLTNLFASFRGAGRSLHERS